ncbi:hypothetical protein DRE_02962 [Drechslerella stenobrocha 248]|uniref:Uncharacterized protein n=1 Tax=Drechslerella stenobrocha 248 TaxID=1043628 RepID=W7I5L9_9PEZI|nr:hypothetical protein DRE_02962 [Drechslerella stenobrocha 248]
MAHFKPTQRKNGGIVLSMRANFDLAVPDTAAPAVDPPVDQKQHTYKQHSSQRKRHHSSFSPPAAAGAKPSRKH